MNGSFTTVHPPTEAVGTITRLEPERAQISLRDDAYLIEVERVAHACHERGWV